MGMRHSAKFEHRLMAVRFTELELHNFMFLIDLSSWCGKIKRVVDSFIDTHPIVVDSHEIVILFAGDHERS